MPYDRRIGLGSGPESVGLAQAAVWLDKQDVFENASSTLFRLTGQRLSASTIQRLITYNENQDTRLASNRFRDAGLNIGSSQVEAACKHLVDLRMKRCGMRWSNAGSQQVLSLRAACLPPTTHYPSLRSWFR